MQHSQQPRRAGRAGCLVGVAAFAFFSVSAAAQHQEPAPAASSAQSQPSRTPRRGNADNGRTLYNAIGCWSCHGYSAQGARTGPRLAPNPIPFPAFVNYIRAPRGEMPPYTAKVVSEEQLADIYAFLVAIPRPREAKEIPALAQ